MQNSWDYEDHENRHLVTVACRNIQVKVAENMEEISKIVQDTRSYHLEMFEFVTPANKPDFAGNYRGSRASYLINYDVVIGAHHGAPAHEVEEMMQSFHSFLIKTLEGLNQKTPDLTKESRLVLYSRIISHFIVAFLSVHPYANGNGHISRLIAWALFCDKGFNIKTWDLDKRPNQPFDNFIAMYQQGEKDAMAYYFLDILMQENIDSL